MILIDPGSELKTHQGDFSVLFNYIITNQIFDPKQVC